MSKPERRRPRTWWVAVLTVMVAGVPVAAAIWLVVVANQPIWVKAFGATVMALAGLWNLFRARQRLWR